MKTILVPTDFSKQANNALDYATNLAKAENARIILLHAWEINYPASDIPVPLEFVSEQIHAAELNAIVSMKPLCYKVQSAGISCEQVNKQGWTVDVVLDTITKYDVDLVIMGTKGASGLKEIFIGSNTAKVIQKVKCPVIAVPGKVTFKGLKKITFATNYETTDIDALKKVADLAKLFNAHITLLHIADEHYSPEGAKAILQLFSDKVQKKIHYHSLGYRLIYGKDPEEQLDEYVKHKHADLFVMSTLHHAMFDRLFGKSLTKSMAYHTHIPLMVFHHSKEEVIFI